MKLLVYSAQNYEKKHLSNQAELHSIEIHFEQESLRKNTVSLAEGYDAVAIFSADQADENIIQGLADIGVRYICLRSVGYDQVDLAAARKYGIRVANVPAYSPHAIAEHAIALLLAVNRKLNRAQKLMEVQDFRLNLLVGSNLYGKTASIVGTGHIGEIIVRILKGFGCKVIGVDPYPNQKLQDEGLVYMNLEEALPKSDYLFLACPLNSSTHHLLNAMTLSLLPKHAILVNIARGAVIDSLALIESLENKNIAGAGLDVYEREKGLFFFDWTDKIIKDPIWHRLHNHPSTVITAHQAFLTHEALQEIAATVMHNLKSWSKDGRCANELK